MTTIHFIVGIPASGKSTAVKKIEHALNAKVFSSDEYRERMYGDAGTQGDNNVLFETIHRDIEACVASGIDVIYDATNIDAKKRIASIQRFKKTGARFFAWVMMTPVDVCKQRNANRERVVPEYVIDRMWKSFTMPQYAEGFDKIIVDIWNQEGDEYKISEMFDAMKTFNQDNPHHTHTLLEHTMEVLEGVRNEKDEIRYAALLHDVGKLYTKVFMNARGEPSDIAHFYNHEHVSAYEAVFYLENTGLFTNDQIVYICGLIQNHMRMYSLTSEKAKQKLISQVGEKMFTDLIILNAADADGK